MLGIFDIEMILLVYSVAVIVGTIMIHNALCDIASAIDNNTEQIELTHKSINYLTNEIENLHLRICKESLRKEGKL